MNSNSDGFAKKKCCGYFYIIVIDQNGTKSRMTFLMIIQMLKSLQGLQWLFFLKQKHLASIFIQLQQPLRKYFKDYGIDSASMSIHL